MYMQIWYLGTCKFNHLNSAIIIDTFLLCNIWIVTTTMLVSVEVFCKVNHAPPLQIYISPQHSRVAKRDQLQESPCRRRSTIPTSTKTTSMSTGTSCFQRLGFSVQIFSINVSALSSPSPSWCPRRTACLNRSGETLGFSRALGKH